MESIFFKIFLNILVNWVGMRTEPRGLDTLAIKSVRLVMDLVVMAGLYSMHGGDDYLDKSKLILNIFRFTKAFSTEWSFRYWSEELVNGTTAGVGLVEMVRLVSMSNFVQFR